MKTTYEIKEYNDWEGETFSYIVELEDKQFLTIKERFENCPIMTECCSINPISINDKEIKLINKHSTNSYMNRMNKCTINENINLSNFEYAEFPYKMNGMKEIKI